MIIIIYMEKVNINVHYPMTEGIMAIHNTTVTRKIKAYQLVTFLRNRIKLNHLTDIQIHVEDDERKRYYHEKSKKILLLKNDDVVHILSDDCYVTHQHDDGNDDIFVTNIEDKQLIKNILRLTH